MQTKQVNSSTLQELADSLSLVFGPQVVKAYGEKIKGLKFTENRITIEGDASVVISNFAEVFKRMGGDAARLVIDRILK